MEATRLNRRFIGIDTNPVAILISEAKVNYPEINQLTIELDNIIESVVNNPKCFKTIKIDRKNELLKGRFEKELHFHLCLEDI